MTLLTLASVSWAAELNYCAGVQTADDKRIYWTTQKSCKNENNYPASLHWWSIETISASGYEKVMDWAQSVFFSEFGIKYCAAISALDGNAIYWTTYRTCEHYNADILASLEWWSINQITESDYARYLRWQSSTATSGEKYVGEFKDNKYDGQGTATFSDGSTYVGEWKDGAYDGQGIYTFANKDQYVGEHKNGKRHGQGTKTLADGIKFVGEWKKDKPWIGTVYKKDGSVLSVISEGASQAVIEYLDGSYVGELHNRLPHGQGKWTNAEGDKYVGNWQNGVMHGQGTFIFFDTHKYTGQFSDGRAHGRGVLILSNDTRFDGVFRNGKKWWGDEFDKYGNAVSSISNGKRHPKLY